MTKDEAKEPTVLDEILKQNNGVKAYYDLKEYTKTQSNDYSTQYSLQRALFNHYLL